MAQVELVKAIKTSGIVTALGELAPGDFFLLRGDAGEGGGFYVNNSANSFSTQIVGAEVASNIKLTLPPTVGNPGEVLQTDGAGVLTFTSSPSISSLTISGDLAVGGNFDLTGNITIGGNSNAGDAATDTLTIAADITSNIIPDVDDTYDLGSTTQQWKDLYINGKATIDTLQIDENSTLLGTLSVAGSTTLSSTLGVTSNTTIGGTLGVSGATTLSSTLGVTGATTLGNTLSVTGATNINNNLSVSGTAGITGATQIDGALTVLSASNLVTTTVTGGFNVVGNSGLDGTLTVTGDTTLGAQLAVVGQSTFLGTFIAAGAENYLGNNSDDRVAIYGLVNSDIVPDTDLARSLGSPSTYWQYAYIGGLLSQNTAVGNIQTAVTTSNTIDTDAGNLIIDSAGGTVQINDNIEIQGSAKITDTVYLGNWTIQTNASNDILFSIGGTVMFKMDSTGVFQSGTDVTI